MKINAFYLSVLILFLSCKNEVETKQQATKKKEFKMYVPSEMSQLMNKMYAENEKLKNDILKGKAPEYFSEEFLKIHTAKLTDANGRNTTFESFSKLFIKTQKEIFNNESTLPVKERYNNAINLCIACHKSECVGPIPRIKKLLIN